MTFLFLRHVHRLANVTNGFGDTVDSLELRTTGDDEWVISASGDNGGCMAAKAVRFLPGAGASDKIDAQSWDVR